jgi:basic membrane protein A
MSRTGAAGYIASFPIPEVVVGINAVFLAARAVNPDFQIRIVWLNSWYDPGKEAEAAKALIDQGVDIIVQETDSPAAVQVAEERGVYAFGHASDMRKFAPNAQLTAIVYNWGTYYIERGRAVLDQTWATQNVWWGLKQGMVELAPYGPAVPADVAAEADRFRDAIIAGERHPFTGPIRNQAGELVLPEGKRMADEDLLRMDYYVQGIEGALPT